MKEGIEKLIKYYEHQIGKIELILKDDIENDNLREFTRIQFRQSKRDFKRFISELKQLTNDNN